jgi:1-acyl-sn-glycerol-3-phosphate acyltransferase
MVDPQPIPTDGGVKARGFWRDALQILFFATFARLLIGFIIGVRRQNERKLPADGPMLVVANHNSHLDTLTLLSLFPLRALPHVRPAAAADYFTRTPLLEWLSTTFFNILPIDRSGNREGGDPVECMARALKSGDIVIVFPEGTRGNAGRMERFRSGVGRVLERCVGVEVTPVALRNTGRSMAKGRAFPVPIFVDVAIGESFRPQGDARAATTAIEHEIHALLDDDVWSF